MIGLFTAIKYRSARAIRRALLSAIGGVLVAVGACFLAGAAWIMLAEAYSALFAALILGGAFVGAGLIFLGISARAKRRAEMMKAEAAAMHPATPPPMGGLSPLAEAFIIGLNAAQAARRRK
ncbi:hypothetical protein [Roseovarius nanhaiticus]|uniref:hypothetical protein n=1 Tax=Roseovarius nanhaiticus TaxID=573024 RepID=UPI002492407F|nr:hypothetical protein [Roseovarius nanhaiticus]